MSRRSGKYRRVSPFRQLVADLMHFCQKVPGATVERSMRLAPLVAARQACVPRPHWTAIFIKAMGIVAAKRIPLRQTYMTFPWPRLYEHPTNVANFTMERRYRDEDVVFFVQVRRPERRSLRQIDHIIHACKEQPVESVRFFRRAIHLSRVPWFFRRLVWRAGLNLFGKLRCHNFGTFSLTSVASEGAGLLSLTPLLTSTLHLGLFDSLGNIPVRITFDHRVLDAAFVARVLVELERILLTSILEELRNERATIAA